MTDDNSAATGRVVPSAAEVYETFFVPALFAQWADRVLDLADVTPGQDVLDVGCGTGALTRVAARRLTGTGSCTGLDVNPGMLAVARRSAEPITWHEGRAESLPFDDSSFDRVLSQFALMFFEDRAGSLAEMGRVLRPAGVVAVSTWARLEESPGYHAMADLLERLFGRNAADALHAPFAIGRAEQLSAILGEAFDHVAVVRAEGTARFASIEAWVHTEIRGWTLAETIDDGQYAELLAAAQQEMVAFTDGAGRVEFPAPALIGTARRRP